MPKKILKNNNKVCLYFGSIFANTRTAELSISIIKDLLEGTISVTSRVSFLLSWNKMINNEILNHDKKRQILILSMISKRGINVIDIQTKIHAV